MNARTLSVAVIGGLALLAVANALIISVDVGSDSMKIALVKPGLPFHIVSNPQSKRKVRFARNVGAFQIGVGRLNGWLGFAPCCVAADPCRHHFP